MTESSVPVRCALYRHYDEFDFLLYIGITESIEARTASHARRSGWVKFATRAEIVWYDSRAAAAKAELEAISVERPVFNVVGQDSESSVKDRYIHYLEARDIEWGARVRSFSRAVGNLLRVLPGNIKRDVVATVVDDILEEHGRNDLLNTDSGRADYYSRLLNYMSKSGRTMGPVEEGEPLPPGLKCADCAKDIPQQSGHYVMKDLSVLCTRCYERDGDHYDRLKFVTTDRRAVVYEIEAPF